MQVYKIMIADWRLLKDTEIELIDITLDTAKERYRRLFSPPAFNLIIDPETNRVKEVSDEEAYYKKLTFSSLAFYDEWVEFLNKESIAIAINEVLDFCHRTYLINFLQRFSRLNELEIDLECFILEEEKGDVEG